MAPSCSMFLLSILLGFAAFSAAQSPNSAPPMATPAMPPSGMAAPPHMAATPPSISTSPAMSPPPMAAPPMAPGPSMISPPAQPMAPPPMAPGSSMDSPPKSPTGPSPAPSMPPPPQSAAFVHGCSTTILALLGGVALLA